MSSQLSATLPLPFLKQMVRRTRLKAGSHLLDVGCGSGDVVAICNSLGIETAGIDDDATAIERGRTRAEHLNIHAGTIESGLPVDVHSVDVALVRGMDVYRDDMQAMDAFAATANLLACLKPSGRVAFMMSLDKRDAGLSARQRATVDHFSLFPGKGTVSEFAEGLGRFLSPSFLFGRRERMCIPMVLFEIPAEPISRLDWHRIARDAMLRTQKAA